LLTTLRVVWEDICQSIHVLDDTYVVMSQSLMAKNRNLETAGWRCCDRHIWVLFQANPKGISANNILMLALLNEVLGLYRFFWNISQNPCLILCYSIITANHLLCHSVRVIGLFNDTIDNLV